MSEVLRVRFENSVSQVCEHLITMGSLIENMVWEAVEALNTRDEARALVVMHRDDQADDMDLQIEEQCINLIWSQQPVAADLRIIGTALKAITDLERIGDHAVDIAKIAQELGQNLPPPDVFDLSQLAKAALTVLREALRAFANRDLKLVEQAVEGDDLVDSLYQQARQALDTAILQDAAHALAYTRLSLVALYLERVADHAVNIAERVAFMLTGDFKQLAHSHAAPP